jgi:hypothetical protein
LAPKGRERIPALAPDADQCLADRHRERAATLDRVMRDYGPLLQRAARDVETKGEAQLAVPTVEISARIIRFRWGDSVFEIDGHRRLTKSTTATGDRLSSGVGMRTRARVPRRGVGEGVAMSYLAGILADLGACSP